MQLMYRGVSYSVNPPAIEAIETQQQGIFLGNRFQIKLFQIAQQELKTVQLRYRSAVYQASVPRYAPDTQYLPSSELSSAKARLESAYQG